MQSANMRHNPPELWFRNLDPSLVRTGEVTTTIRVGIRDERDLKGYVLGERVRFRFYAGMGRDEHPIEFGWGRIVGVQQTTLVDMRSEDFAGCSIAESSRRALEEYLARCYGRTIVLDEPLTIVRFSYIRDEE